MTVTSAASSISSGPDKSFGAEATLPPAVPVPLSRLAAHLPSGHADVWVRGLSLWSQGTGDVRSRDGLRFCASAPGPHVRDFGVTR